MFTTLETFEGLLVKFEKYSIDHSIIVFYDFDWTGNVVIFKMKKEKEAGTPDKGYSKAAVNKILSTYT